MIFIKYESGCWHSDMNSQLSLQGWMRKKGKIWNRSLLKVINKQPQYIQKKIKWQDNYTNVYKSKPSTEVGCWQLTELVLLKRLRERSDRCWRKAQKVFSKNSPPTTNIPLADIAGNCRGASSLSFICFSHSISLSVFNDPSCIVMVQIVSHYHLTDVHIEIVLIY